MDSIEPNSDNQPNSDKPNTPDTPNQGVPSNLTPEQLRVAQEELRNYRIALDQEFAEAAEKAETSEAVMETTIDYFKKSVPDVAAQIVFLASNSTSDGVRLSSCKYIIDCVRKGVADNHNDPVTDILESLFKNNDAAAETDTSDLTHDEQPGEH